MGSLLVIGIVAERRQQTVNHVMITGLGGFSRARRYAWHHHTDPFIAVFITLVWLMSLIPLVDHVLEPRGSITGAWVWSLIIVPHEAGHVICIPFGWFLTVAGGSIWQLLVFLLPCWYALIIRQQLNLGMVFLAATGHSLINLSVYIRDAQERDLPLIFGLGEDAHDWWNILHSTNLLAYDDLFADIAVISGIGLALVAIMIGILSTWFLDLPNQTFQLEMFPFRRLIASIQTAAAPPTTPEPAIRPLEPLE